MFSLIIPIYNTERYLRQCLDSISSQSYPDFEALLIDDGSTDGSAAICREYAARDNRFIYYNKVNGGVSSARNMGIEKSKGEWLLFVDSDDELAPDCLQTFADIENKADVTLFAASVHRNSGATDIVAAPERLCHTREEVEAAIYQLKCGSQGDVFGWPWDKFVRASIIKANGVRFVENVSFREDELFAFRLCRYVNSLQVLAKPLYHYYERSGSLTAHGLKKADLLPSSIELEASLPYYSNAPLCEQLLRSITDYRAMDIYASPLGDMHQKIEDYLAMIKRHPQPGKECKINHLTRYAEKGKWAAWLYCLIRKL